jgi:galactose mutarotase-like enzyme
MISPIHLTNAAGDSATISPYGAELSAWRARGVDLIWEMDRTHWDRTAPVLFPVVGWTRGGRVQVKGKDYLLALHGFAWHKTFSIADRRDDYLRLELLADDETRALYPFEFRFSAEFRLAPGALEHVLTIENIGLEPLPYACGLHPAFRWPLAGSTAQHRLVFEKLEKPDLPTIGPGGLIQRTTKRAPLDGCVLPLSPDLFAKDALVFLDTASRSVAFDNGAGARVVCDFPDFPHIGFWTRPGAGYLCLEPWTGHGDPEDFFGDLFEKPSMRVLGPGETARHRATFRFERHT